MKHTGLEKSKKYSTSKSVKSVSIGLHKLQSVNLIRDRRKLVAVNGPGALFSEIGNQSH